MRFIHCADLHLDSRMSAHLSNEKARERRAELLHTFHRMIDYGAENRVDGILIAGDLFDAKVVSAAARNAVRDAIVSHPGIVFYYLRGNHDGDDLLNHLEKIPKNLKLFGDAWTSYPAGDGEIVITGAEFGAGGASASEPGTVGGASVFDTLSLDPEKFNIVLLHGQDAEYESRDRAETISLRSLRGRGIDYLALGHVHSYKSGALDGRGQFCYPGCLEGRGFDECGPHGFVLLDVDEKRHFMHYEFVPFARRNLYEIRTDVSGCMTCADMAERAEEAIGREDPGPESLVRLVLLGTLDVDCVKDTELLKKHFEDRFYYLSVADRTKLSVDYRSFALDESLKGEFVRLVAASELDEQEKAAVIRCGIRALMGEDLTGEAV